jgi:hypothetical protein
LDHAFAFTPPIRRNIAFGPFYFSRFTFKGEGRHVAELEWMYNAAAKLRVCAMMVMRVMERYDASW